MIERDLIRAAWREWRDSRSWCGLSPDSVEVDPPRWFVQEELGFHFDSGPSLMWTCTTLAKANRAALTQLGTAAPDRVTYPRDFDRDPRRRQHHRVKTAAARTRGGGAGRRRSHANKTRGN